MADLIEPASLRRSPSSGPLIERWLPVVAGWQALVALGMAGGALWLMFAGAGALRWLAVLLGAFLSLASVLSLAGLGQRRHRSRVLALVVNYLGLLASGLLTLHRGGAFVGLDRWADTFARGLPFLALALLGVWLASRAESNTEVGNRALQRGGRGLALLALGGALLAWGLLPGLWALLRAVLADPTTLLLALLTVGFGTAAWFWWRNETGVVFGATIAETEALNGYLLLSPNLLGFLIFFAGPLVFSLYVSLTEWSAFGAPQWVGLAHYGELFSFDLAQLAAPGQRASEVLAPRYVELTRFNWFGSPYVLGAKDKLFWLALRNTFLYTFMVVPLSVLPALVLANVLNSKLPGMKIFRAFYFLPSVAAVVGIAVIWAWLYNSTSGFINYGITQAVELLNRLPGLALEDPKIRWLSRSDTALFSIVLMSAWRIVGFNTVLFLAGLQAISQEIYEAASVDGAGTWRKFWNITLPLLAPTTFFVTTTTVIQALQLFDEVFVLINPPAGPNNSTLTAVMYLYQNGFQRFNLGYASAVAWTLFLIIFLVTLVQFRFQRSGGEAA